MVAPCTWPRLMTDPLAIFFTQSFEVKRKTGDGAYGPVFAAAAQIVGRIKRTQKLVVNDRGDEVVTAVQISTSILTAPIPLGSEVRIAGETGWRTVIVEDRHVGGFPGSPDYYSIALS